jgi:membrane protease subunit (stomatin/prohibitin family)
MTQRLLARPPGRKENIMGLIKAAMGAAGGVMADQWKEYFYCESLPADVIAVKGQKRTSKRSSNKHGSDNVISNGSVIAVADGQCMIIVENGQVVDICAEPGEFTYDMSTEPSLFSGSLSETIPAVFQNIGKRFTFGGETPTDQRVYYFNTKELVGNKYGTPSPIPFRVVDANIGLDIDISIRCFGEYSYRVTNPILFYTNVCGNVGEAYTRDKLDGQIKSELLTALQPAFARISELGIRYSALPGHTRELADALNEELSAQWRDLRGIEIVSMGVSSVKASEEDEAMIKELQRNAALSNPKLAAGHMVGAQAQAMQDAAKNAGGAAVGFMGMNMAQGAGGINASDLFNMAAQQQQAAPAPQPVAQAAAAAIGWDCSCGHKGNTGNFCAECGAKKPAPAAASGWTCSCGAVNKGKFCPECGAKKPAGVPQYKCDKCGWEPKDPTKPPKFCPECGDPFDDGDIVS